MTRWPHGHRLGKRALRHRPPVVVVLHLIDQLAFETSIMVQAYHKICIHISIHNHIPIYPSLPHTPSGVETLSDCRLGIMDMPADTIDDGGIEFYMKALMAAGLSSGRILASMRMWRD